jgi:hypothetical protein
MTTESPMTGAVRTDSGMFMLWNPARFQQVVDYPTWERELLEDTDIERHIAARSLVPIGIGVGGSFGFTARAGSASAPATLDERELQYLVVSSEPYGLDSDGRAWLTGIEEVSHDPVNGLTVEIPAGTWSVVVNLIDWQAEPGSTSSDGVPTPTALPDFVVLLNRADQAGPFRQAVATFDQP